MRKLIVLAFATALSACASLGLEPEGAPLQNIVYVAGDNAAPVEAMQIPLAEDVETSNDSALNRLYWYFAGR